MPRIVAITFSVSGSALVEAIVFATVLLIAAAVQAQAIVQLLQISRSATAYSEAWENIARADAFARRDLVTSGSANLQTCYPQERNSEKVCVHCASIVSFDFQRAVSCESKTTLHKPDGSTDSLSLQQLYLFRPANE